MLATVPLFVIVMVVASIFITSFPQIASKRQNTYLAIFIAVVLCVAAYISFLALVIAVSLIPLILVLYTFGAILSKFQRKTP